MLAVFSEMGNDIQRPNSKLVRDLDLFREFTSAKLKDIREARDFWKSRKSSSLVGKNDFDEVKIVKISIM